LLRAGMSVEPTVNTKTAVIAERGKPDRATEPSAPASVPVARVPVRSSTAAG
jgi:hypothetical protein